ncbi:MAG: nicotinate phosphoribosyltransferase [Cryomorphaceae bacterium]|jgi:nicotinate phosphoribosyltransferase
MTTPLLTDLYQITMAYGYWKNNMAEREAVFHLFFRRAPFGETATIVAGTCPALDYLSNLKFTDEDCQYLQSLSGHDKKPLFEPDFIDYLKNINWSLNVEAVAEGNLAFANEPLLRVSGPLVQCQLVETALLNLVNFQTLVSTKAARIHQAAEGDDVMEFGLRRAQGPDGGVTASRAAYIGGCMATSNVLAGHKFGIPVKGTHAHSWVMSFDTEEESFRAYADALPNNVILLVDTYDTVEGVKTAIKIGNELREKGYDLLGIRLDSGDLVDLSQKARALLDAADMHSVKIVASNDLDENIIKDLKLKGAKIDVWGIGTKLVTCYDQPALGGVYKLGAILDDDGEWKPKVKLSNDIIKVSNPGTLQVSRNIDETGRIIEDIIFDDRQGLTKTTTETTRRINLLQPGLRNGQRVLKKEDLAITRKRAIDQWSIHKKNEINRNVTEVSLDPYVDKMKHQLVNANKTLTK